MKKYIFVLFSILLAGCSNDNETPVYNTENSSTYNTIIIDSCEYIDSSYGLAHKGNCKFCKERRLKEMLDCYD